MNRLTWEVIGGLMVFVALLALAFYCVWRDGRDNGYEEGYGDALASKPLPGRHRMSQPREAALPSLPAAAPSDATPSPARTALVRDQDTPRPVTLPSGGAIAFMVARSGDGPLRRSRAAVTAADIPPVFWSPEAAPSKLGAADTGRMLELSDVSTTGGFRAVTDEYIAQMMAEDAADREARTRSMRETLTS